jgi:membrane protease YdiL (CAAX protease family)
VALLRVFPRIYIELAPHVTASILGQLMWIRTGILSVLTLRGLAGAGFGFVPARKDWSVGFQHFAMFTPVAIVAGTAIHFAHPHAAYTVWWKVAAQFAVTFAGILWVVALWEEFFCRGMLQQILARRLNSAFAGLVSASIVFGLAHLPYRSFPNWRFAIMAALAGLFYGWAFLRAGSVRASMVTHALVVATWKVFFV